VEFLIDHKSENLHIFILTRSDPPLPLTRWRGRQQLTEIRSNDLMFSGKEIREFLNGIMEFKLSDREIFKVTTTSQGWAVSVYFTALHIQKSTFKQGITSTLRNSKINIMDYIKEEVISQLPDETTTLMRQTSILNSISSDLCEALTSNPNSEQILRGLEANNFFVSFIDENHRWFSYHPLVKEFLKQQLLEIEPQNIKALHLRASGWFANNGNLEKAIYHAIEGQDFETAASHIKTKAFEWIDKGQYVFFISWMEKLPHEFLLKQPLLISLYLLSLAECRQTHQFTANIELISKLKMDTVTQAIIDSAFAIIEYINENYDNSITIVDKNLRKLSQKSVTTKEGALAVSSSWLIKSRALLIKNNFLEAESTKRIIRLRHYKLWSKSSYPGVAREIKPGRGDLQSSCFITTSLDNCKRETKSKLPHWYIYTYPVESLVL
jgi:ATP/maltotriose-dependent transcriptional regulator MalT